MALVQHVDYGGLVSVPTPFLCRNADVWNFFVKADGDKLDALCKRVFYDPSGGAVEYVALGDHVMLAWGVVESAESLWPEPAPPAGVPWNKRGGVMEPQVCVWVPTAQVKREGTKRVATKFVWFMPYIWVDNAMSLATGRETLGYPKTFGRFRFPQSGQPREWTLEAFGLEYAPQSRANYHPLMEVKETGGFTETLDQPMELLDVARDTADRLFGTRDPGEVRPGIDFYLDGFKNALQRQMYQVFLKQIRSAEPGLGAALQQVVEARYDIKKLHGFPHPHPSEFQFTVRQIDSHPVIDDLGLYPQEVVAAVHARMDFEVGNGRVLWDSRTGSAPVAGNGHGRFDWLFDRLRGRRRTPEPV